MPGILKVGKTDRTPLVRLSEANAPDTWRPPTPYKIEFAKKVSDPSQKEKTLHDLLEKYTERIHPRREFFRVTPEEVHKFFDLIDGKMWDELLDNKNIIELKTAVVPPQVNAMGCRNMSKCFRDGQRIRHVIDTNIWIGVYNSSTDKIICDEKFYKSLSGFAATHYSIARTDRCESANGWKECECEVDGRWISTFSLPG